MALTTATAASVPFVYVMAIFAPSTARRLAMAAPMPREPPVMSATFPSNFFDIVPLLELTICSSGMSQNLLLAQGIQSPHWISQFAGSSAFEGYFVRLGSNASQAWGKEMELRHLRYFVAVAETQSLSSAAKSKLHTSQPSLSRQLRDLEEEIGAQLMTRTARGVELTPAGRAFLDHAAGVLLQVDPAAEAARRAVHPAKPCFSMGFLTGHELTWMPEALRILRDELPNIDVMISSQYSPLLAEGLSKGIVDAAFLRREQGVPELAFRPLVKEPLVVVLPSDHRLAARKAISPGDLVGETFVGVSHTAPVLRAVIDDYLKRSGINITPDHETDHVTMGISLIMSTRGVGLLPAYAQNFLPASVTSRRLKGESPTVDLVLGYRKSNQSPILKLLLSRLDELVERVSKKIR